MYYRLGKFKGEMTLKLIINLCLFKKEKTVRPIRAVFSFFKIFMNIICEVKKYL